MTETHWIFLEDRKKIFEEVLLERRIFRMVCFQHCAKEASDLLTLEGKVNRLT